LNLEDVMKRLLGVMLLALAVSAGAAEKASTEDVEARLKAARERLEAAAKEVADLSGELALPVMDQLMVLGKGPPRSMIGVQLDPESGKEGARVVEVSPGGAAAEAGIRSGDVIVAFNGEKISGDKSAREVTKRMRDVEPKSKIKLRVMRDGQPKDFEVTARPASPRIFGHVMRGAPPLPPEPPDVFRKFHFRLDDEVAGMELATLTPALGKYFGTDKGVLVVRAPDRASFKLEDGDVILAIGGREPTSGSHATRILRSYQPGEKIDLKLMRQHKQMNLAVTLPDQPNDGPRFNQTFIGPGSEAGAIEWEGPETEGIVVHTQEDRDQT
jgi:predicted metalloprotease with PDZ domain